MSPRVSIRFLSRQSDQRLVELVGEGHERAFEALVHRYRRPLLRYCRGLGLSAPSCEDVVQQALTKAWLALARGVEVRQLKPWLYRTVHNTALNALRDRPANHAQLAPEVVELAGAASAGDLDSALAARDALAHLTALPDLQRDAILLTAVEGRSHDEAAGALGVSHAAVRGLIYRARASLRSAAAAVTPQPLLGLASGSGGSVPAAERLGELSGAGGSVGLTGVLVKGALGALAAGTLATGAAMVHGSPAVTPHARATSRERRANPPASHASATLAAPAGRLSPRTQAAPATAPRRGGGSQARGARPHAGATIASPPPTGRMRREGDTGLAPAARSGNADGAGSQERPAQASDGGDAGTVGTRLEGRDGRGASDERHAPGGGQEGAESATPSQSAVFTSGDVRGGGSGSTDGGRDGGEAAPGASTSDRAQAPEGGAGQPTDGSGTHDAGGGG